MPARPRVRFLDEPHGRRLSVACTFNNGSGIMRYELGIAGGLGYKYESSSKDFRRLVLFPSVVFGEQLQAFFREDGRELLVRLKGSLDANPEGAVMPAIELIVDDPELASLDPKKLKARLHLLVENSSWCGAHWDDAALTAQARQQAEAQAAEALDWLPPEAAEELGDDTSRESRLHWFAKEILLQEKRLHVPALAFREPWGGERPRGYLFDSANLSGHAYPYKVAWLISSSKFSLL